VGAQERAGTRIADGGGQHLVPVLAADQDRVAGAAVVRGHGDGGSGRVRSDQAAHGLGADQGLIGQGDHRRVAAVRTIRAVRRQVPDGGQPGHQ